MKRIEKLGEYTVRAVTYPLRVCIGIVHCINKSTPDTLDDVIPFEFKRKEDKNGSKKTRNNTRAV